MASGHGSHQVKGSLWGQRPPCKFHNFWTIVTPPGWSCLFVNPLDRPNGLFEVISGIVDTDINTAPVHFPFVATGPDGLPVIENGSPMVQVIPFRSDAAEITAEIRPETAADTTARDKVNRNTRAGTGWYRTDARAPRK